MFESLNKIANMSPKTQIYCGHEYTINNLKFALTIESDNHAILSGNDISYCAFRACGGDGGICVTTNFLPKQFLKMEKQIDRGDLRRSKQMHFLFYPVIKALFLQDTTPKTTIINQFCYH